MNADRERLYMRLLHMADTYPSLVPRLYAFLDELDKHEITPEELSVIVRIYRRSPSILVLLVELLDSAANDPGTRVAPS